MKKILLSMVVMLAIGVANAFSQSAVILTDRSGARLTYSIYKDCNEVRDALIERWGADEGGKRYAAANCQNVAGKIEIMVPACANNYFEKNPNLTPEQREAVAKDALMLSTKDFCAKYTLVVEAVKPAKMKAKQ